MKDRLIDYMVELNGDPELMAQFKENPRQAAQKYNLYPEDIALLAEQKQSDIIMRCSKITASDQASVNVNFIYQAVNDNFTYQV